MKSGETSKITRSGSYRDELMQTLTERWNQSNVLATLVERFTEDPKLVLFYSVTH
jgi:hypothetical protein